MGEFRNDCCQDAGRCECDCMRPQNSCTDSGGGFGILILLLVLYCLFCGNDNRGGGGLLGGLF